MKTRLKRYKKIFEHSYAFGVFPTLELLTNRPTDVQGVIVHPQGKENSGVGKIIEICQKETIPVEFQERTFARIGARNNDYAVGVFRKTKRGLDPQANHVILVNPSGMGNLGTIIRTMLGFNFLDLAVIGNAADIFHPDVVRASMGALFGIRFDHFTDFQNYTDIFPRNYYPLMSDGAVLLPKASFESIYGLIFGPENAGLPEEYHQFGTSIRIPQSSAIDSLNLAISVGVTLYQISSTYV